MMSRMVFRWPNWEELQQSTPAFWARLIPHVVMCEQGRHGNKGEDGYCPGTAENFI